MPGTRLDAAIAAIVTVLSAGTTATLATVVDGPSEQATPMPGSYVFIGWDGDLAGDYNATENWEQDWAALGAQRKNESFDVVCAVVSGAGDPAVAARRQTALAILAAVESDLRAPLNIGLGLPQPTTARLSSAQLIQEWVDGLRARIPFSISVQTRI
jgi:hypothetical protein